MVKYFCDKCKREVPVIDIVVIHASTKERKDYDKKHVCYTCYNKIASFIEKTEPVDTDKLNGENVLDNELPFMKQSKPVTNVKAATNVAAKAVVKDTETVSTPDQSENIDEVKLQRRRVTDDERSRIKAMVAQGVPTKYIAETLDIPYPTVYQNVKKIKAVMASEQDIRN